VDLNLDFLFEAVLSLENSEECYNFEDLLHRPGLGSLSTSVAKMLQPEQVCQLISSLETGVL